MTKRLREEGADEALRAEVVLLLRGTVIDSPSRGELRVLRRAVLGVDSTGRTAFCEDEHDEALGAGGKVTLREGGEVRLSAKCVVRWLPKRGFVCPGLVDTHTHAPQFSFAGIGYDLQLLEWLETYTFPSEAKFKDLGFAARVCANAVRRTLRNGTTSCLYFATIHTDAAVQLGRIASGLGQRCFVGKVNMDRNAPASYCERTDESLAETARFVKLMLDDAQADRRTSVSVSTSGVCTECEPLGPPAQPVITPRFVPTCSTELMSGLGAIASTHRLIVTSHISENLGEIDWVRSLHPDQSSYASCYDTAGLLGPRTVLAHGVYLDEGERALLASCGSSVSHCPMSNSMLRSGMLNVRRMLDEGVAVSLGTDVCGGACPSMLSAIREALKVSNLVSLGERRADGGAWSPLSSAEAFHLATAAGARSLGVEDLTGDFTSGALFDAIVIDPEASGTPFELYEGESERVAFEKWLMLGDDRNTSEVYVQGRSVLSSSEEEQSVLSSRHIRSTTPASSSTPTVPPTPPSPSATSASACAPPPSSAPPE